MGEAVAQLNGTRGALGGHRRDIDRSSYPLRIGMTRPDPRLPKALTI